MEALIQQFTAELKAERPESSTPSTYRWAAERLQEFLTARGRPIMAVDAALLADFVQWLGTRRKTDGGALSPATVRVSARGAKAFLQWAMKKGFISRRPVELPALPEVRATASRSLTDAELSLYRTRIAKEADPVRAVLTLLPLLDVGVKELCGAPMAGLGRTEGGASVLHLRPPRAGPMDIGSMSFEDCRSCFVPVRLPGEALHEIRSYLIRFRPRGPWLFPGKYAHISATVVRSAVRRLRVELDAPWLTPSRARKETHDDAQG